MPPLYKVLLKPKGEPRITRDLGGANMLKRLQMKSVRVNVPFYIVESHYLRFVSQKGMVVDGE